MYISTNILTITFELQSPTQQDVLNALKKRLEETTVPEFPRHRLRMLSKLSEGAFGTVSKLVYILISNY